MLTDLERQAIIRLKAAEDANEGVELTAEEARALLETIRRLGAEVFRLKTCERVSVTHTH